MKIDAIHAWIGIDPNGGERLLTEAAGIVRPPMISLNRKFAEDFQGRAQERIDYLSIELGKPLVLNLRTFEAPPPGIVSIEGCTLEVTITEIRTSDWRWIIKAVVVEHGKRAINAAWAGTEPTSGRAFEAGMRKRGAIIAGDLS